MKITLLCGGSSPERGISLNSARSVLDHLSSESIEIIPVYFDYKKKPYLISKSQLYSNTPSDFDFKLSSQAKALNEGDLVKVLTDADITFPAMHGAFGEDGQIQYFLEKNGIPFVGSGSRTCKTIFDKYTSNKFVKNLGFPTLPCEVLKIFKKDHKEIIEKFFKENNITRAIVKPATGGSSIGVFSVSTVDDALERVNYLFSKRVDTRVVIEPFCEGTEFTVIVLQNRFGLPVAILPTEIETDYSENQIFDFRKKYLPTRQVTYHCPPRFDNQTIEKIQYQAEQIFSSGDFKDFARFDGWVLPDGNIWFSDLNPVSGMEQNSFLFQQASRIGMSHKDLLVYLVRNSCLRQGIKFSEASNSVNKNREPINVLFGGSTSERQVSLMSGTNVWLKLRNSNKYEPRPFLLDTDGNVWKLPYTLILNHTVEEITAHAKNALVEQERLDMLENRARTRLGLKESETSEKFFLPEKIPFKEFLSTSPFVFNALHGGIGEDGTLQKYLEEYGVKFNGSGSTASKLCINKWETVNFISKQNITGVTTAPSKSFESEELLSLKGKDIVKLWNKLKKEFQAKSLIIKPTADGCSTGVVHLYTADELHRYLELVKAKVNFIPKNTFRNQDNLIEMPSELSNLLLEKFIETDSVRVVRNSLKVTGKTNWLEITIGVLGERGHIRALNPSITVAEGEVLSLEEKFQGGTGINITPPSIELIRPATLQKIKDSISDIANRLALEGYARIDAFVNTKTGELIIIEVNTLPGLTPSTVIFHQALAENPPLYPKEFLEQIITASGY